VLWTDELALMLTSVTGTRDLPWKCPCLKICFNNIFVFNIFGTRSHWWTT